MSHRHDNDNFDLYILIAVLLLALLLGGCASREPSSTDRHSTVPQVICSVERYHGTIHQICCEDERCAFVN